jgi:hypothetical protein
MSSGSAIGRHQDHRELLHRRRGTNGLHQSYAVHDRHSQIGQHRIPCSLSEHRQRFTAVVCDSYKIAVHLQAHLHCKSRVRRVVHDQNCQRLLRLHLLPLPVPGSGLDFTFRRRGHSLDKYPYHRRFTISR